MSSEWTLPLIQVELEGLPIGCDFILDPDDVARLFGRGSGAVERAAHFAAPNGCRAALKADEMVFRKCQPADSSASPDLDAVGCFPAMCAPRQPTSDDFPPAGCR